jgi:hypothetical protein
VNQAQEECKKAISVCVDITTIVDTEVNTRTQYKTEGEAGSGAPEVVKQEAAVESINTTAEAAQAGSFLHLRRRRV